MQEIYSFNWFHSFPIESPFPRLIPFVPNYLATTELDDAQRRVIGSTGSSSAPRGERADERRWSRTEGSKLVVKAAYWSRRSRSYGESANRFEGVHGRAHVKRPIPPRSVSNPRYYRAAHKSQPAIERAPLHRERGARSISMDAAASIAVARLPPRIIRFPSPRKVGGERLRARFELAAQSSSKGNVHPLQSPSPLVVGILPASLPRYRNLLTEAE